MDTYSVTCLICKKGIIYLHYIDSDDVECLNTPNNKSGWLVKTLSLEVKNSYYSFWTRRTSVCRNAVKESYSERRAHRFHDILRNDIKSTINEYTEVVIMAFTNTLFNTARDITPDDTIVGVLKSLFSNQVLKWVDDFHYVDEFAPKDGAIEKADNKDKVDDALDIERDSDNESDDDSDDESDGDTDDY